MAATGHFYLNNSSVGAPQLNNSAGSLIAVLDWALDVGVGTHWEKVFSGTNKAVYRSKSGTRFYLRVDDTVGEIARLRMYQTMSDVDTGTLPSPNGSPQSSSYCTAMKADEGGGHTYYIVGDERYFCMLLQHDNIYTYRNFAPFIFGEYNTFDPLDSYNVCLVGAHYTSNNAAYNSYRRSFLDTGLTAWIRQSTSYIPTANNPNCFSIASPDGLIQSSASMIHNPWAVMDEGNKGSVGIAHYGNSPALVYSPYYIIDSNGASGSFLNMFAGYNGNQSYVRGTLPYIYATPYAGYTGETNGGQVLDGASEFRTIQFSKAYESSGGSYDNLSVLLLRESDDEPGRNF